MRNLVSFFSDSDDSDNAEPLIFPCEERKYETKYLRNEM